MNIRLNKINRLPVILPERTVFTRLGYNHHLTGTSPRQKEKIMQDIYDGFALCQARGIWARLNIVKNDGQDIELEDGTVFQSKALAGLLKNSIGIWLAATTVGPEIMDGISTKLARHDGKAALIYDAVGGETADAAMDYLQAYVNKTLSRSAEKLTKRRFSAGYSDLELTAQRDIFQILELEDWGLTLTESMLMIPEKSVTAIAGITPYNGQ